MMYVPAVSRMRSGEGEVLREAVVFVQVLEVANNHSKQEEDSTYFTA